MSPPSPQLPIDDATSPAPRSLKRAALLLFVIAMAVVGLIAFVLPKKHVEAAKTPTQTPQSTSQLQRAQTDAYKKPVP